MKMPSVSVVRLAVVIGALLLSCMVGFVRAQVR